MDHGAGARSPRPVDPPNLLGVNREHMGVTHKVIFAFGFPLKQGNMGSTGNTCFLLVKNICLLSPVGFKGNLSLLEICSLGIHH